MKTLLDIVPKLQLAQLRHDEIAHQDILCLPIQDRIKHMVLHFAKYCGHLADIHETNNLIKLHTTLVDTFIITLASANTLNIRLAEEIQQLPEPILDITCTVESEKDLVGYLFPRLTRITGTMAKACESLDHLEEFNYRGTLEQGLVAIASLLISVAIVARLDLAQKVRERWAGIENKYRPPEVTAAVSRRKFRIAGNDG